MNPIYKVIISLMVIIAVVAGGIMSFSQYNPILSLLTTPPSSGTAENNVDKPEHTEPEQTAVKKKLETIKKVRETMMNGTYLTDPLFQIFSNVINMSTLNDETIKSSMINHFPGWNGENINDFEGLVKLGCGLLKKSGETDDITSSKYVDVVTSIINLIINDLLIGYEVKRTILKEDFSAIKVIELVGRLFNMYQYVVNSEDGADISYGATKELCEDYLEMLVPKFHVPGSGASVVVVNTPRLLSLYISNFEGYENEIELQKDNMKIFKDSFNEIKDTPGRHDELTDYDYYYGIFSAFNFWN